MSSGVANAISFIMIAPLIGYPNSSSKRSLFPRRLTIIPAAPIASAPIRVIGVGIAAMGTVVGPIAEPAVTGPGITAPAGFCRVGGKRDKGERERSHCYDQSRMLAH